ncbi:MAG: dephospho-CoA kinase [Clostridia bacterium]|nr:dephospho-CoA kinase [Clostridia bacterium]
MKIIGITGGIGAGKSTVSAEFKELGAKVIDADAISRSITTKEGQAYGEIVNYFGESILSGNGEINRKALAEIVFSNKDKLDALNEITHKHIFNKMQEEINASSEGIVVLDVPLLFSDDFKIPCDIKIAVLADENLRIERAMKRDGMVYEEVVKRIENQMTNEEYMSLADIYIWNNDLEETKKQVREIYESMRR